MNISFRPRRARRSKVLREMLAETRVHASSFIYPMFVKKEGNVKGIPSMPGVAHWPLHLLLKEVEQNLALGIDKILLFGVGESKDAVASSAHDTAGVIPQAVRALKETFGNDLCVVTDVCVCAYTDHGHCGILGEGEVINDESAHLIAKMALTHAQAGADIVAPSDMMDGRVAAIRALLDEQDCSSTSIMSYSTKFASAYYGPFRDAADSAPGKGDRKTYQMDFRNGREAILESILDEEEGADILMVKPALAYLDVIKGIKEVSQLPLACYNVSGEYSMVKFAAEKGLVDEQSLVMENMLAFKRAGADIIISYHCKDILQNNWL